MASLFGLGNNAVMPSLPGSSWEVFAATQAPEHEYFYLVRTTKSFERYDRPDWRPLITDETRRITALRLGLDTERKAAAAKPNP